MISSQRNIKALLIALHTPGLDEQLDRLALDFLDFKSYKPDVAFHTFRYPLSCFCFYSCVSLTLHLLSGLSSSESFFLDSPHGIWCVSSAVTALRLLAITSLLRALASRRGYEAPANTLLSFYSVTLPLLVGPRYQPPSLPLLVTFWDDSPG